MTRYQNFKAQKKQATWLAPIFAFLVVAGISFLVSGFSFGEVVLAQGGGEAAPTKNLFSHLKDGGPIGLVILLCSIAGVSLSIAFAFQIRRDALVPPELLGHLEETFEDEDYDEAYNVTEGDPSFLAAVTSAGLAKIEAGYEPMIAAMEETGDAEATKLHQKVGYLQLIAAIAPMLGLLGTVNGMITTFTKIATSPVQPKPADLAGGISQALVTTFMGLTVAIPMTVAYAFFRNRVVNIVREVGGVVEELMERFKPAAAKK